PRRNGRRWLPQRRFPPRSGGWRFPRRRVPRRGRGGTQPRVPAGSCTARQSVCVRPVSQSVFVRPVQSVPPPPPFLLCRGAVRRRRRPLWRLVLELAADPVGMAAGLGLRRLRLLLRRRETEVS